MADAAMELNDKNGDGVLDEQELADAPGLKAAAEAAVQPADTNGDGMLSRDEIRDRIAYYEETRMGLPMVGLDFRLDKQPLAGAKIELIPEPFLEGVLDVATGTTRETGFVLPTVAGEPVEGVRPGMYRIKVTSPTVQIPAKYNENTTLGLEVITPSEGYPPPRPPFELETG